MLLEYTQTITIPPLQVFLRNATPPTNAFLLCSYPPFQSRYKFAWAFSHQLSPKGRTLSFTPPKILTSELAPWSEPLVSGMRTLPDLLFPFPDCCFWVMNLLQLYLWQLPRILELHCLESDPCWGLTIVNPIPPYSPLLSHLILKCAELHVISWELEFLT